MKISGPRIFAGALVSAAGAIFGVIMLVNAFCLLSCTLVHQRATDRALAVIGISFLVLVAIIVAAIKAIRRRNGRRWAIAALWVAALPVAAGSLLTFLVLMLFGS